MFNVLKTYWPSLLVVAVIIYATWIPKPIPYDNLPGIPHIDKLIHAIMFGGLAGALMFDYYRKKTDNGGHRNLSLRIIILMACISAAFGVLDETVQGLLKIGRPSDTYDLMADWVGVIVAIFTAPPVIRSIFKKKPVV